MQDDKIKEVMEAIDVLTTAVHLSTSEGLKAGDTAEFQDLASAKLSSRAEIESKLRELVQIPTGYALVPVEPTDAMARAFRADVPPSYFTMTTIKCADFSDRYSAMLAAAQKEIK